MHKHQILKHTSGLDGKFLTMVCCQEMLVQQEEKDVSFNSKKKKKRERNKKYDTNEETLLGAF